jgi:broad specificity phosphatase PhoE
LDIFIIRHAQSANNALPDIRDREVDPPLTELGQEQSKALAQHLKTTTLDRGAGSGEGITEGNATYSLRAGYGITALYCSPMLRSLQTTLRVKEALGIAPQVWVDLHERGGAYLDQGPGQKPIGYPGSTRSEILARFPDYQLPPDLTEDGWWNRDFEDLPATAGRAIRVAGELLERSGSDERIALISHGYFIDQLLKALLGQLPGNHIYYRQHNTAISRGILRTGGPIEVRSLNQIGHLTPEMVS